MTPELAFKIDQWRSRAIEGTITQEELTEALAALREDRRGAAVASEKSRKAKAKAVIPSADDLLDELGAM